MKRFHVHVAVADLDRSIGFYSTLFDREPSVRKPDYAKWMLEDPRVNFAISKRADKFGVNHLGLQVDEAVELDALHDQLERADASLVVQNDATCCYAKSNKYWVTDPQGVAWETFHTLGDAPVYGDDGERDGQRVANAPAEPKSACCASQSDAEAASEPSCCVAC